MKFIYSFKKTTFFSLDGNNVEVRTSHKILNGLFCWDTKKTFENQLTA